MATGDDGAVLFRIHEAAVRAGVSERTLRYYEELGLVSPATRSAAGTRRYSEAEIARVIRVRELQDLVGLNLDQIVRLFTSEDRVRRLVSGSPTERLERKVVLEDELTTLEALFDVVRQRADRTTTLLGELREQTAACRLLLAET
jgi:MerR family transcriptional regulator, repressor of the yfmOP operon